MKCSFHKFDVVHVVKKENEKVIYFTSPPYFRQLFVQEGASVDWIVKEGQRPFIRITSFPNVHEIHYKGLKTCFDKYHPICVVYNTLT